MKLRNNKKGFTIVELVIVIAVIGVLTAILVPVIINLTNKANQASDNSLIKNLNTALKMVENDPSAEDEDTHEKLSGKNNTMQDVVLDLKYEGYYLENLVSKSGQDLLWDASKNEFFLNDDPNKTGVDYWQIVNEVPATANQKYSYYAGKNFNTTVPDLKYGFDAGYNTGIEELNYVGPGANPGQTANVRTNGGALTVNAPNDIVNHYGNASFLNIEAVKTTSYHEYGQIASAQIKTGRIVIENSEASIDNLLLISKADKSGFEDIIVETKSGGELPKLDRTEVNISSTGTLVVNVVTPVTNEFIYLTKAGVIEQVVVTEEKKADVSEIAANVETKSVKTQTAAQQISNVGKKNSDGQYVDTNNNVIAIEDLTIDNIVETEKKASQDDLDTGLDLFVGGAGTEKSPYLIANLEQWNNLATNSEIALGGKSFAVINDLTFDSNFKYIPHFIGNIDFQEHTISCQSDMADEIFVAYTDGISSFKNLNVENYKSDFSLVYANKSDIKFENINMRGNHTVSGHNSGMFIMYVGLYSTVSEINIELNNCNVYSSITGVGSNYVGAYLGTFNYLTNNQTAKLIMKDCTNYGTLMGEKVSMVVSSSASCGWCDFSDGWVTLPVVKMYFDNVYNKGLLHGNSYAGLVMSMAGIAGNYEYVEGGKTRGRIEFYSDDQFEHRIEKDNERVKLDKDITPSEVDVKNVGTGTAISGAFSKLVVSSDRKIDFTNVKDTNATKYVVSFGWTGIYGSGNGGAFAYNIEIPADQIDTAVIYDYEWVNSDTYGDSKAVPATELPISEITYFGTTLKIDSDNNYVFCREGSVIRVQPTLRVYVFDSNDNIIKIGTEDGTAYAAPTNEPTESAYNFIQVGYGLNMRCGSDGTDRTTGANGYTLTNQIHVQTNDIIFVKGLNVASDGTHYSCINSNSPFLYSDSASFAGRIGGLGTMGDWQYFSVKSSNATFVKLCLNGLVSSNDDVTINIWRNGQWVENNN